MLPVEGGRAPPCSQAPLPLGTPASPSLLPAPPQLLSAVSSHHHAHRLQRLLKRLSTCLPNGHHLTTLPEALPASCALSLAVTSRSHGKFQRASRLEHPEHRAPQTARGHGRRTVSPGQSPLSEVVLLSIGGFTACLGAGPRNVTSLVDSLPLSREIRFGGDFGEAHCPPNDGQWTVRSRWP